MKLYYQIRNYIERIYRLSLSQEKREKVVWADMVEMHTDAEWDSGIYESRKTITTTFRIAEESGAQFHYSIYDGYYYCRVKVIEELPVDLITDAFILATHFNNRLNWGVVGVDAGNRYVDFQIKIDLIVPLLYKGEVYNQLLLHNNTAKDIYWAFDKLIKEREHPAIIFADLLKRKDD